MARTFMPKAHYMPIGDQYRPMYRWFMEAPWRLVPRCEPCRSAGEAIAAAEAYLAAQMNKQVRSTKDETEDEAIPAFLDADTWRQERAGRAERDQRATFGAIFVRHKQVQVETKKRVRV